MSTTRVKQGNIRDRWLMNTRTIDYEIYIRAAFLLIQSKEEHNFAVKTKMIDLVLKDFVNLESYIE